jgi:hypothetical protein
VPRAINHELKGSRFVEGIFEMQVRNECPALPWSGEAYFSLLVEMFTNPPGNYFSHCGRVSHPATSRHVTAIYESLRFANNACRLICVSIIPFIASFRDQDIAITLVVVIASEWSISRSLYLTYSMVCTLHSRYYVTSV